MTNKVAIVFGANKYHDLFPEGSENLGFVTSPYKFYNFTCPSNI